MANSRSTGDLIPGESCRTRHVQAGKQRAVFLQIRHSCLSNFAEFSTCVNESEVNWGICDSNAPVHTAHSDRSRDSSLTLPEHEATLGTEFAGVPEGLRIPEGFFHLPRMNSVGREAPRPDRIWHELDQEPT